MSLLFGAILPAVKSTTHDNNDLLMCRMTASAPPGEYPCTAVRILGLLCRLFQLI